MFTANISLIVMMLFTATALAGRDKPKPTCDDCDTKLAACVNNCKKAWEGPTAYAACAQHACVCEVGKDVFCRKTCGYGGPESLCFY